MKLYEKIIHDASENLGDVTVGLECAQAAINMILESMDDTILAKHCVISTVEDWRAVLSLARDRIHDEKKEILSIVDVMPDHLESIAQETKNVMPVEILIHQETEES